MPSYDITKPATCEAEGKVVPFLIMKAYRGNRGTDLHILDLGTIFRTLVSLNPCHFTHGEITLPLGSESGRSGEGKNSVVPAVLEHRMSSPLHKHYTDCAVPVATCVWDSPAVTRMAKNYMVKRARLRVHFAGNHCKN